MAHRPLFAAMLVLCTASATPALARSSGDEPGVDEDKLRRDVDELQPRLRRRRQLRQRARHDGQDRSDDLQVARAVPDLQLRHLDKLPGTATLADGARWRPTPQAYLYAGPVGMLAEYVVSSQRVSRLGEWADVQNRVWNLTAVFVLTMEHASFDGVKPRHPVDFRHFALGAWEVVLRYSELRIDNDAFPLFADATVSVRAARELAAGLDWYFMGDREAENALLVRLQIAL